MDNIIGIGSKGVSVYCPIDVKFAPKKLEVEYSRNSTNKS